MSLPAQICAKRSGGKSRCSDSLLQVFLNAVVSAREAVLLPGGKFAVPGETTNDWRPMVTSSRATAPPPST